MPLSVASNSRYKISTPIIAMTGVETFGLMKKYDFLATKNYIEYKVAQDRVHRPDLIALDVYGSVAYYWIVLMYNKPRNPFGWPENQAVIRLPALDEVVPEL